MPESYPWNPLRNIFKKGSKIEKTPKIVTPIVTNEELSFGTQNEYESILGENLFDKDQVQSIDLTDEEIHTIETSIDPDELPNTISLDAYQEEYGFKQLEHPDLETLELLNEIYVYDEYVAKAKKEREVIEKEKQDRFNALPSYHPDKLDEYNLMADIANKVAERKQREDSTKEQQEQKNNLENIPEYSAAEINLMQEAYLYQILLEKNPDFEKLRPTYADGKPLADAFIKEQAVEYEKCKQKNLWSRYTKNDIKLMQSCAAWQRAKNKLSEGVHYPSGMDEKPLEKGEIKELAGEFADLIKNNPDLYIKLQVENKVLTAQKLTFKQENFKGKPQWVAYKKYVTDNSTKVVKYITQEKPVHYKNGETVFAIQAYKPLPGITIAFIKTVNDKNIKELFTPKKPDNKPEEKDENQLPKK